MENNIDKISGLSEHEAVAKLKREGLNELPSIRKRSIFDIAFKIISEPMFILLVAGGALYLILGNANEALILVSFVFVIMGITFYQEHKTERALDALRKLASPRALVIRDGVEKRIAGNEVVRGDIVVVHEGDYVPADAKLISANNLAIDESLLTGESVPVNKISDGDSIFASTLVVHGYGIAKVYGTGINTKIGKIGVALQTIHTEKTPLQRATLRLVRNLAIVGLSFCALAAIIYGVTRGGEWLNGILAGITLAMAILPEEFPVILTTFLAIGAWRISREKVLTRRVPAVETLGSASVLCVDKTGTLTVNQMKVNKVVAANENELLEYSILASQRDPFDPMEKAIKQYGEQHLKNINCLHKNWKLIHEYPLSNDLFAISHVWQAPNNKQYVIATKGAPEAIIDLCHLNKAEAKKILQQVHVMASEGLRVLGVAKAVFKQEKLPSSQHDFNFKFAGLIGLVDPIRPKVPDAIQKCHTAGIRVIMITGDYSETAVNIASKIGFKKNAEVITGSELQQMSDAQLRKRIKKVGIFARIIPEQKLRIVNALKANGEIVAMTGDGVNDAPAMKAAHIGIAMGERGTDVAREASELVLLDDDFSSIVAAVKLGRRIFANIRKAMTYTFAVHIPIVGMSLIPIFFKWPLILLPVHIVFLELIIDPACSIVFEAEPEDPHIMQLAPRDPQESLFTRIILQRSLLQGMIALMLVLAVFGFGYYAGYDTAKIRTLTFTALVLSNIGLIFSNRSWSQNIFAMLRVPNSALWWIISGALFFLVVVIYVPWLHSIFSFANLSVVDMGVCLAAGIGNILCFEVIKFFSRSKK